MRVQVRLALLANNLPKKTHPLLCAYHTGVSIDATGGPWLQQIPHSFPMLKQHEEVCSLTPDGFLLLSIMHRFATGTGNIAHRLTKHVPPF